VARVFGRMNKTRAVLSMLFTLAESGRLPARSLVDLFKNDGIALSGYGKLVTLPKAEVTNQ
jgi:hypothetical protein